MQTPDAETVFPAGVTRLSLELPQSWLGIDIERALRSGLVGKLVDRRLEQLPQVSINQRSQLVRGIKEVAENAHEQGATYCAVAVEQNDGQASVWANLAMIVLAPEEVGQAMAAAGEVRPEPSCQVIASQISTTARVADSGADWQHVRLVELPAGQAVRVEGVSTLTGAPEGVGIKGLPSQMRMVTMQNLLPIHGTGQVANLVFNSGYVDQADQLLEHFAAISDTLRFFAQSASSPERKPGRAMS